MKTKDLVIVSLFTALTAVCAQIFVPLPFTPVSVTLQTLAVFLSGAILGSKKGALSQLVYILLGAIGIPVFSEFSGGLHILAGITGGYIWGFPIAAYIIGKVVEIYKGDSTYVHVVSYTCSLLIGIAVIYTLGTLQFSLLNDMTFMQSLKLAVIPFIPADLFKIGLAVPMSISVKKALVNNKLLYR
ncbi:biotin transporter BioY [Dethiothermospora halolimnae]|uniref:biotin transporter BioY n=1 Tax=Dethiothermospora halolimnae TaxID=3114390 RepID=UPI003CCB7902